MEYLMAKYNLFNLTNKVPQSFLKHLVIAFAPHDEIIRNGARDAKAAAPDIANNEEKPQTINSQSAKHFSDV